MNIFGGRPGIAAGVLAVTAILAAAFCILQVNVALLVLGVILAVISIVFSLRGRIKPYRLFVILLLIAVFSASLLRGLYVFYRIEPDLLELCGSERYLHGTVIKRLSSDDHYSTFIVRVHSINGAECDRKAKLNCEYTSELQKGYEFVLRNSEVIFVADLEDDEATSLIADGIFLSVNSIEAEDYAILSENNLSLKDRADSLNSYLSAKIRNDIKGEEGRLVAAMLLGDKSALTNETYRDFSRSGLSHYLAVSGLHVSIITGIVSFLLSKLRIRRSARNLLITLFSVGYLCLLGFPVSAIRAVIMLLTVFLAYSMGDVSDSLNALGIAAMMIVFVSPTAVFDRSFILSFCATLGIVSFMPSFGDLLDKLFKKRIFKYNEVEQNAPKWLVITKKIISFVFGTLMSVAAALSLTLLPTGFFFGEASVLGFKSNLMSSLVAAPLLASSLLFIFVGDIPYLGEAVEWVIVRLARGMIDLASSLSEERNALVSLSSDEARKIIIAFTVIILIALVIKIKRKHLLLILPALYPLVILAITISVLSSLPGNTELTFVSLKGDEMILARYDGETAIIDISDGSLTRFNHISMIAHEEGVTEYDTLVLTHYHTRHLSSVSRFIASERVRRVILPYPETDTDAWIMAQLADTVQSSGVACEIISPDEKFRLVGDTEMLMSGITRIDRSAHPILYLTFSDNEGSFTYLSASSWDASDEYEEKLRKAAEESDMLFFGAHGPVAKNVFDIPLNTEKEYVVFDKTQLEYLAHPLSSIAKAFENGSEVYTGEGAYKCVFGVTSG
ncbi:MAG: ComEC/Rec2 family competence protein [Clostridia bacterium]|nr:ComEC/Rec2 family competence protein [Clostridia bacterium]